MIATRTKPPKSPTVPLRITRCAIYCRKSTDENLDSGFNSLDAQREAAEAYILSQKAEGWMALETRYDDPAYSAATTDRPALQRLLADIEAGKVDAVIVYKLDRLSRSLRDFGKLMEIFEQHGVAFVSITQKFDTSSSMGQLILNVLVSFAEFERSIGRERILDKIAGAKKRGKHTGGTPILGYTVVDKRLVVVPEEAALVRRIFERYVVLRSPAKLADELNAAGYLTKSWPTVTGKTFGGRAWTKADIYKVLSNPKYQGKVEHKGTLYVGEHEALVSQDLWDQAHAILAAQLRARSATRHETPALLRGLIKCGACNCSMGPTFTKRHGRTYPYYLCTSAGKKGYSTCPVKSVAAGAIESAVISQLRVVLKSPEVVARTFREARLRETEEIDRLRDIGDDASARVLETHTVTEAEVVEALQRFDGVWDELFPGEQQRIVQLLVERVDVKPDGIELRLRGDGLKSLVAELQARNAEEPACP